MSENRHLLSLSILNLVGFLATIVVNALANILPINGVTTAESVRAGGADLRNLGANLRIAWHFCHISTNTLD